MPYVRARLNKSDLILALPDLQDAIFHWIFLVCPRLHVSIELRPRIRNLPSGIGVEKWEYWTMIRSESAVVDSGGRVRVASQLETSLPPPPPLQPPNSWIIYATNHTQSDTFGMVIKPGADIVWLVQIRTSLFHSRFGLGTGGLSGAGRAS